MKFTISVFILALLSASLLLAACDGVSEEQQDSVEKTIIVGPQMVDCEGVAPQKCLLVKENPQAEYTLFYEQIEGFDYEEGYEYELRVTEETVENPPADGSSLKWTLVEEVSKKPVEAALVSPSVEPEEEEPAEDGEVITMYVGPELVDCVGVGPQTCMQVKMNYEDDYTLFYNQIAGFEHEPGYEYELLVLVEQVENPPADGSSLKYTLVEEVDKSAVEAAATVEVQETSAEELTLEGTTWILLSYIAPDGQPADVLPNTKITGEFIEGQVVGNAGCNRYFGSYSADGSSLTIDPAGTTMMFCSPEEIMLQETAYLATLSNVAAYELIGSQLHIRDNSGNTVLLFTAEEPLSLSSVTWNLISYNNGNEAMVSVINGAEVTANFGDDGILAGSAGCNSYSAGYETNGSNLTIGLAVSTQMLCSDPEGVMEQETQYLTALQNAATYRIDGTRLEIRNAGGAGVAYYTAAEPTAITGITWNLLFHNNGNEAMVSTIIGTEITALFDEEGTLSGSAGCNRYTASYEINGDRIKIGPAATTRKFCEQPEGIMEQEGQYLAALENAAFYKIEGSTLDLRDETGAGVASYSSLGAETAAMDTSVAVDSSVPSEITTALSNASYPLDYTGTGTIQLADGEYRQAAAEDSAAEIITQLTQWVAMDEMSDGKSVVATILVSQTGGSGTFYDLLAMDEQNGILSNPVSTYLGDRIVINDLAIENDQIFVDMVVQGLEDPFCCPTLRVIQTYELQDGELVQISSEETDSVESQSSALPDIRGIVWKWQELVTPLEEVTIDTPEKYTVEFKEGGELSVSADCNVGSGTYEIDGQSIAINVTSTTLALCAEGSYGDLFFRSLEAAAIYFMDGDFLMIDQIYDSGTMRFFE